MAKTNAEMQARYRKKQELGKFKDKVFQKLQLGLHFHRRRETPDEIHALLQKAASLPSGWNDEDLGLAKDRIMQLYYEFESPRNDLEMDVHNGAGFSEEFVRTPDPNKLFSDFNESVSKTRALASHLIAALELSALPTYEQAAAVIETARHVGRAATISGDTAKSNAMMLCYASLQSHYDLPDWFLDSLTQYLSNLFDKEIVQELGKRLNNI